MPAFDNFDHVVCEACTVRTHVQRELRFDGSDFCLLALERARIIDTGHCWSTNTYKRYQGHLRYLKEFEQIFHVPILVPPVLARPVQSPSIPLMWAQERYLLRPGGPRSTPGDPVVFGTARGIRSAANMYYTWLYHLAHGDTAVTNDRHVVSMANNPVPNQTLSYSLMTTGMRNRRGDIPQPSVALLARHVHWIDNHLETSYTNASTPVQRRLLARAGMANLGAWLGWLRGGELFGLDWDGVSVIEPGTGAAHDIPGNHGAVIWKLLAQTKSARSFRADVVLAYETSSGFNIGRWFHRLKEASGWTEFPTTATPVFCDEDGQGWTSQFYRSQFLLPLLDIQRLAGDPHLTPFDGSTLGNSLADKFYSMHSYRAGGRTHVSRKREGCLRKATTVEVNDHGRWRDAVNGLTMEKRYLQAPIFDRLAVTLFCM
jgi:hypothetical protein